MFNLINRGMYSKPVEDEFQHLFSRLRAFFGQIFDADGVLIPGETPSGLTPIGSVLAYAGSEAPPGWLLCNGQAVSRAQYEALFRIIGTTYGNGDGATSFNAPDLRQRFVLGKADSGTGTVLGSTGGNIDHTHSVSGSTGAAGNHDHGGTDSAGAHTHSVTVSGTTDTTGSSNNTASGLDFGSTPPAHTHAFSGSGTAASNGSHSHDISDSGDHTHSVSATAGTANPPFLVLNMIIFAGV